MKKDFSDFINTLRPDELFKVNDSFQNTEPVRGSSFLNMYMSEHDISTPLGLLRRYHEWLNDEED